LRWCRLAATRGRSEMRSRWLAFACCLITLMSSPARAQAIHWAVGNLREVSGSIRSLSRQDQHGILESLRLTVNQVRVERIARSSGVISGSRRREYLWSDNCAFWILDDRYKVLLEKVTQSFGLQRTIHNGRPDVITSMHSSAFESSLSYWRFQRGRYTRVACADADGNVFQQPHISRYPCGTGG
jgi:hypothetical protein